MNCRQITVLSIFLSLALSGCIGQAATPSQDKAQLQNLSKNISVVDDKDSHGCMITAGYEWCEIQGRCIRLADENCTDEQDETNLDANGCVPSEGYSWCENLRECIRPWEIDCDTGDLLNTEGIIYDMHGCEISNSYVWCEERKECILPWEIDCAADSASDNDTHGCDGLTGYSWCEPKQSCIRAMDETCD